MAREEHLDVLRQGVVAWNRWRTESGVIPDLSSADLNGVDLSGIDLTMANLNYAQLFRANLSSAFVIYADMISTNLEEADLQGAILQSSRLMLANLRRADMRNCDLMAANFSLADLTGADISGSKVFGISPWGAKLDDVRQTGLVITQASEPVITVDNLAVAQFVYLLLNNATIRDTLNTITSKVVLILGRFTAGRKVVLDTLRDELRRHNYSPIIFDFEKPTGRDLTETISTLAHLARFVIADITEPRSIPQELASIVPHLPSVPVQPLLEVGAAEYGMFEHFRNYPWVLPVFGYGSLDDVVLATRSGIIEPAERYLASPARAQ